MGREATSLDDFSPSLPLPSSQDKQDRLDQHKKDTSSQKTVVQDPVVWDFPGGAVVKNPPSNAGDTGSSPGPGGSHMLWSN